MGYWKNKARDVMQNDLKEKYQFFKSLTEINSMFGDNQEFVSQVKKNYLLIKFIVTLLKEI